jgi:hypothetical protein
MVDFCVSCVGERWWVTTQFVAEFRLDVSLTQRATPRGLAALKPSSTVPGARLCRPRLRPIREVAARPVGRMKRRHLGMGNRPPLSNESMRSWCGMRRAARTRHSVVGRTATWRAGPATSSELTVGADVEVSCHLFIQRLGATDLVAPSRVLFGSAGGRGAPCRGLVFRPIGGVPRPTEPEMRRCAAPQSGRANATYVPPLGAPFFPPPHAITMYCFPFTMYMDGVALPAAGSAASQSRSPVSLSNARIRSS